MQRTENLKMEEEKNITGELAATKKAANAGKFRRTETPLDDPCSAISYPGTETASLLERANYKN